MIKYLFGLLKGQLADYLGIRRKPQILQIPITNRCNSKCVTCNVWKNNSTHIDLNPNSLRKIFLDEYFQNVTSVGLNGGEFTLYKDFDEIVDVVLSLPNLKFVSLISNGLLPDRLFNRLRTIYPKFVGKGVQLAITLSIDGIGKVQNQVRGVGVAWDRSKKSIEYIIEHKNELCDIVNVGCTISKYNVFYLAEVDSYLSYLGIPVEYHLAVPNKRIGTFENSDYSVLKSDRARLMAIEFFYRKYIDPKEPKEKKIRYYMQMDYLKSYGTHRLASCSFLCRDLTIDESCNLYLCATASDSIGNLLDATPKEIFHSKQYKDAITKLRKECHSCVHYVWYPSFTGFINYYVFLLKHKFLVSLTKFRLK